MSDIVTAIVALLAVVAAVLGYGARQKAKGKRDAITQGQIDAQKRMKEGRDAVSKLRGADRDDLLERLRRNGSEW